jgi:hypothetical protein
MLWPKNALRSNCCKGQGNALQGNIPRSNVKNWAIAILVAAVIGLAALYLSESHKRLEVESTLAKFQQNAEELEAKFNQQQQRTTTLQTRLQDSHAKAVAKAEEISHLEQALTNHTETAAKSKNPMAEMLKNPDMKEFVKVQQKAVLSGMIDKNYATFFSGLSLNSQQSASLKELIIKKSLVDAQMGMSLMSGDAEPAARAQILEQAKTDKESINEEIKQMLGDDNYQSFQSYEKTQPERMSIGMFKDQLASGSTALAGDQEEQLIQALSQERQSFKFTTDFYDQSKIAGDLAGNLSDEKLNKFEQERDLLNQKYLERAQTILSAQQIQPFEKFLSSQSQLQNAGIRMAAKMFGQKPGANAK